MEGETRPTTPERKQFWEDEFGTEIVEWVVVTLILTVAAFVLLQAVGPELNNLVTSVMKKLR
jgi:Flp pilus assembly pilin Flp